MPSSQQTITLVALLILLSLVTYIYRPPSGDDAWFAEQSYWLLKDGVVRSEFFAGFNQWDKELLVSHKLFLYVGAALMYFFGYDLPVVQCTGLLFFLILIAELLWYMRLRGETKTGPLLPALLFLIFANRLLVKMSFQNRPEMMLAALGFGSFLLLFIGKRNGLKTLTSGILAGMAFVAHMNGIIFLIGGAVTLLLLKAYKRLVLFCLAGGFSTLLYWIDILDSRDGLSVWIYQFTNDPAASHGLDSSRKVIQLLTFPRMFFHSPEQISLSLLFAYVAWKQWPYVKQLPIYLRTYFLTILASFWLITKSNSAMYMVLFIPFMLLILYELYRIRTFVNWSLKIILLAYLVIGIVGMGQLIEKNWKFRDLPANYRALASHTPHEGTGLVPLTFFFNEYEQYDKLLAHENYKIHYGKKNLSADQMASWAYAKNVNFILYDYEFLKEEFYPPPGQKNLPHYKLTFYDGRFAVYSRI